MNYEIRLTNWIRPAYRFALALFFGALLFCGGGCTNRNDGQKTGQAQAQETYTCPMHPSVISGHPGACPVCGMALVKKSAQSELSAKDAKELRTVSLSPTQRIMANVATTEARRETLTRSLPLSGVVDYAEPLQTSVTARFRGRIDKLVVNFTGERVLKGRTLFELYSPDLISTQQDYLATLDALQKAQTRKDASSEEMQQELLSSTRSRLVTHYGMTRDQISALEAAKKVRSTVAFKAPMSGIVVRKSVQEGQYVDEGTPVYALADLSKVWVYLEAHEPDLRFISKGQKIDVTTDAWPGQGFKGTVTFIDPMMNPQNRTIRVRAEFANKDFRLKPGMYAKARISIEVRDALIVPAGAVIATGNRSIVWVEVKENEFEPRTVTVGSQTDGQCEILSGLDEGDLVVSSGGYLIDSESRLTNPDQAAAEEQAASLHASPKEPAAEKSPDRKPSGVKDVAIMVEGAFTPDVIRAEAGQKLRLSFYRNETAKCTEEVLFKDFGIRKTLPAFKTTVIEITPKKPGVYKFSCGMEMVHGKIIVR